MTHEDAGHYAKKHPEGTLCNPKIAELVKIKSKEKKITCAVAHKIAEDLKESPASVGVAIDLLEMRISKCQLGLFGYSPHKKAIPPGEHFSADILETIERSAKEGRISCDASWGIAKKTGNSRMDISSACEKLGIKITECQLGAF
jgi:hypothetical protein